MKSSRKNKNLFFCCFFSFILFLSANFCLSAELNVDYPAVPGGSNITITSQTSVPEYLKYVFDFGMFVGFFAIILSLIYAGVLYFLSPAIPDALTKAKDRISGAVSGLLILITLYLIITTINPGLKFFKTTDLKAIPPPEPKPHQAGVYLYKESKCPALLSGLWDYSFFSTVSAPDLYDSKQQIKSVKIVHDWQGDVHYISILYENLKFWGKCQYIDPNTECQNIDPFAMSISVYKYNYYPKEGAVTFYRKPFFDSSGGSYKVLGSATKDIYNRELKKLKFENVPEEEQKCVKWDVKGICIKKEPQDLSGENISSIEIDGDYLVLLVYFDKDKPDPEYGPWSFCQAFGTFHDEDKKGPREIKWENIRNLNSGNLPNYVLIFPIEGKIY